MDAQRGYKQTEAGLVPTDWDVKRFGDIAAIYRGASPRPIDNPIWFDETSTVGWVRISDVTRSKMYLTETSQRLSALGVQRSRYVPSGNLIMSIAATVGRPIITRIDVCIHDGFVVFERLAIHRAFLFYVLAALEKTWANQGQTGSQMNLNTGIINRTQFALPPTLTEQRAIAEALSDADAFIESLERLLAKKRQVKQGALQDLLTGKRRLPGFSGGWVRLNMAENSTLKARIGWQGLTTAEYLDTGDYLLVTGTDFLEGRIDWTSCCYVAEHRYTQDKNIQLRLQDVLLTKDGTIGKVALVDELPSAATLNSGVFVIRPKNGTYDPRFLFYVLSSRIFDEFLNRLQAGSTITHLYQKDFTGFSFLAPATLTEQTAIAAILSDMDAEIDALEAKLAKARSVKQGMMQELLTGRVRLL